MGWFSLALFLGSMGCEVTIPDATLGCEDGRCPAGFVCQDEICRRSPLSVRDSAADVHDAGADAADAADASDTGTPPPRLVPSWSVVIGGTSDEEARALDVMDDGSVVVVGTLSAGAMLGGVSVPGRAAFVSRHGPEDGTLLESWLAQSPTRTAGYRGVDVAGDAIYATGNFTGTVEFRSGEPLDATATDAVLLRYDVGSPEPAWVVQIGGATSQAGQDVSFDSNRIYVTGGSESDFEVDGTSVTAPSGAGFIMRHSSMNGTLNSWALFESGPDARGNGVRARTTRAFVAGALGTSGELDAFIAAVDTDDFTTRPFIRFLDQETGTVEANDIALGAGGVCSAGRFNQALDLGDGEVRDPGSMGSGYVQCVDLGGTFRFADAFIADARTLVTGIDQNLGVGYVTGHFSSAQLALPGGAVLDRVGNMTGFIYAFDFDDGTPIFGIAFGTNDETEVKSISVTSTHVYVAGRATGAFVGFEPAAVSRASDAFVAAFELMP
jgi:hypothetical protein